MEEDGDSDREQGDLHIRVSSKHLIFASPVFKALLSPHFEEGSTLASTGRVDLPLPEDDPRAMLSLLGVIHNRFQHVPDTLDSDELIDVAILVDKYELHDATHLQTEKWSAAVQKIAESYLLPQGSMDEELLRTFQLLKNIQGQAAVLKRAIYHYDSSFFLKTMFCRLEFLAISLAF
ncbi:MAG: hypothetical protein MMC23_002263 [Stictis urceolatum]|nr:hypothetical protein [Stictis urceolata]